MISLKCILILSVILLPFLLVACTPQATSVDREKAEMLPALTFQIGVTRSNKKDLPEILSSYGPITTFLAYPNRWAQWEMSGTEILSLLSANPNSARSLDLVGMPMFMAEADQLPKFVNGFPALRGIAIMDGVCREECLQLRKLVAPIHVWPASTGFYDPPATMSELASGSLKTRKLVYTEDGFRVYVPIHGGSDNDRGEWNVIPDD